MSLGQTLQEETAEKVAESPDREKGAAAAANPSVRVCGQSAAGNGAVEVGMMVDAGPVSGVRVVAEDAACDIAAQRRSAAGLDGLHQAMLMQRQRVRLSVGGAVLSKDVGQLQGWLRQGLRPGFAFAGPWGVAIQVVERADGGG